MTTYVEYELTDGTTILIEGAESPQTGLTPAGRDDDGNIIKRSSKGFQDALAGVKASAAVLRQQLDDLKADEVEVTFGLKATGEAGNFAIGKVGIEANYTVKLKWNNQEKIEPPSS